MIPTTKPTSAPVMQDRATSAAAVMRTTGVPAGRGPRRASTPTAPRTLPLAQPFEISPAQLETTCAASRKTPTHAAKTSANRDSSGDIAHSGESGGSVQTHDGDVLDSEGVEVAVEVEVVDGGAVVVSVAVVSITNAGATATDADAGAASAGEDEKNTTTPAAAPISTARTLTHCQRRTITEATHSRTGAEPRRARERPRQSSHSPASRPHRRVHAKRSHNVRDHGATVLVADVPAGDRVRPRAVAGKHHAQVRERNNIPAPLSGRLIR